MLELAIPLLEEAAGAKVEGVTGDADPLAAIEDAINRHGFDEIILSTLPASAHCCFSTGRGSASLGCRLRTEGQQRGVRY